MCSGASPGREILRFQFTVSRVVPQAVEVGVFLHVLLVVKPLLEGLLQEL